MFRGQCWNNAFKLLQLCPAFVAGGSCHWFRRTVHLHFLSDMQFIATQYVRKCLLLESGVDIVSG